MKIAVIILLLITMKARLVILEACDKICQQNVVIGNMHLLPVHHNNNSITRPASKTFMKHWWSLEARLVITRATDNTCQQNVVIGNMYLLSVHHNNNSLTRPASETLLILKLRSIRRRCSVKMLFLKTSQISQGNTSVGVSF